MNLTFHHHIYFYLSKWNPNRIWILDLILEFENYGEVENIRNPKLENGRVNRSLVKIRSLAYSLGIGIEKGVCKDHCGDATSI